MAHDTRKRMFGLGGSIAVGLLTATAGLAQVSTYQISVPATANIFAAGRSQPDAPAGGGAGTLPVRVCLPADGQTHIVTITNVSGSISFFPPDGSNGPEGINIGAPCTITAPMGISTFQSSTVRQLLGVFSPQTGVTPPVSQALNLQPDYWSPGRGQLFHIGDGRTAGGRVQSFVAPAGAQCIYLGFADGWCGGPHGGYGDNTGELQLRVETAPCRLPQLAILASTDRLCTSPQREALLTVGDTSGAAVQYYWAWAPAGDGNFIPLAAGVDNNCWQIVLEGQAIRVRAKSACAAVVAPQFRCIAANVCSQYSSSAAVTLRVCKADIDCSGSVDLSDLFDYLRAYFAATPAADTNGVDGVTVQDVFDYLVRYFAGC